MTISQRNINLKDIEIQHMNKYKHENSRIEQPWNEKNSLEGLKSRCDMSWQKTESVNLKKDQ